MFFLCFCPLKCLTYRLLTRICPRFVTQEVSGDARFGTSQTQKPIAVRIFINAAAANESVPRLTLAFHIVADIIVRLTITNTVSATGSQKLANIVKKKVLNVYSNSSASRWLWSTTSHESGSDWGSNVFLKMILKFLCGQNTLLVFLRTFCFKTALRRIFNVPGVLSM